MSGIVQETEIYDGPRFYLLDSLVGDTNMNVDGSGTPEEFKFSPDLVDAENVRILSITFTVSCDDEVHRIGFGKGTTPLPVGIDVNVKADANPLGTTVVTSNLQLVVQSNTYELLSFNSPGVGPAVLEQNTFKSGVSYTLAGGQGLRLSLERKEFFSIVINDDMPAFIGDVADGGLFSCVLAVVSD